MPQMPIAVSNEFSPVHFCSLGFHGEMKAIKYFVFNISSENRLYFHVLFHLTVVKLGFIFYSDDFCLWLRVALVIWSFILMRIVPRSLEFSRHCDVFCFLMMPSPSW